MEKIIAKSIAGGMVIDAVYEVSEETARILTNVGRAIYFDHWKNPAPVAIPQEETAPEAPVAPLIIAQVPTKTKK